MASEDIYIDQLCQHSIFYASAREFGEYGEFEFSLTRSAKLDRYELMD